MSKKHLKFIDSLPCVICGGASTHHHLLRVDKEYLTPTKETEGLMFPKVKSKGMGTKSDDKFCLPVCDKHHKEAHRYGNDKRYFQAQGIEKPEALALSLWRCDCDIAKGTDIIKWILLGKKNVQSCGISKGKRATNISTSGLSRLPARPVWEADTL